MAQTRKQLAAKLGQAQQTLSGVSGETRKTLNARVKSTEAKNKEQSNQISKLELDLAAEKLARKQDVAAMELRVQELERQINGGEA